jgi:hypothetical protein
MEEKLRILGLFLIALIVVAAGCSSPAPEVSTATPVPPTETPVPTEEPAPTQEPTATEAEPTATAVPPTEEPTATPEPTATAEADTPTAPPTEKPEATGAPVEDAQVLLERRCTVCHTLERVEASQKSREEWESTVDRMIEYGTQLTDDERAVLIDYLVANYGS